MAIHESSADSTSRNVINKFGHHARIGVFFWKHRRKWKYTRNRNLIGQFFCVWKCLHIHLDSLWVLLFKMVKCCIMGLSLWGFLYWFSWEYFGALIRVGRDGRVWMVCILMLGWVWRLVFLFVFDFVYCRHKIKIILITCELSL